MKKYLNRIGKWMSGLSFRTGAIIAGICAFCYIASFAQMALPISIAMKGTLWVILFGMAKATQYTAILILGKEGWRRLRSILKTRRSMTE